MTHIVVKLESGHMEIKATGHADYAPPGQDIVCAAISAIMQTAFLGLSAIAEQYPEHVEILFSGPR